MMMSAAAGAGVTARAAPKCFIVRAAPSPAPRLRAPPAPARVGARAVPWRPADEQGMYVTQTQAMILDAC